ncbi:unnamed protein product [Candida verbasci]|uniref:Large ribosomal subunit protein mL46 n=1 Tax=Candida verbasci TaxID=1227364 RepID=A0A9W4XN23_9ASCO|nr:unnamed protein product [Candida verbasci]
MNKHLSNGILRKYSQSTTNNIPKISSTLILSRLPVITTELSKFEKLFYKYQEELWRRLMWTFPKWFYFNQGTLAELRYKQLNKGSMSYDPKILYPRGIPDLKQGRDRRFRQYIKAPKPYKEIDELSQEQIKEIEEQKLKNNGEELINKDDLTRKIIPNQRVTKADLNKDDKSLERRLERTLYLIIKVNDSWILPTFENEKNSTSLHELAESGLYKIGGDKINYYNVSRIPCHVKESNNNKEYFIKSHILSGIYEPQDKKNDYKWLTKEELKTYLPNFNEIEHLFSEV